MYAFGYVTPMGYSPQKDAKNNLIAPEQYGSRNDALAFAQRTRTNLEFINRAHLQNEAVHPITQTVNSLLGLVIFIKEKELVESVEKLTLAHLCSEGWPRIDVRLGQCETLGDFVHHLRNAAAHGRILFSSDSTDSNKVAITFSDKKAKATKINWRVQMNVSDLETFCLRFIEMLLERR